MEKLNSSSTTVRKPWGGLLEATRDYGRPAEAADAISGLGLLLRKFTELSLLATLIAVPLMYHFSLPAETFAGIQEWFGGFEAHRAAALYFFEEQLSPYISGTMPVLESKFTAWFALGILMMAGYASLKIVEGLSGRQFLAESGAVPESSKSKPHRLIPLVAITLFLIYALASFLFWPPQAPPEAQAVGGRATAAAGLLGSVSQLGGAGFMASVVSWLQILFALFFFLVCEDLVRDRHFVNKILGIIVLVGLANAMVVVLQKTEFGPLMKVWIRWGPGEFRNNLGAFIGHNTGVSSYLMAPLLISLMWMLSVQPRKRQGFRVLLLAGTLLMCLALLLAQSRAVLPILVVCVAVMVVLMARRSAILPKSRLYIWFPVALFFALLTQVIPSSFNPLYRRDVTLVNRLDDFSVSRLLTETRLRILVVSMAELIPKSPMVGYGWGSFQYVYPNAQGDFFQHNPRSILAPTEKRSFHAHNEYLQTLIETGLVGLILCAAGLGFLIHGGWKVMQRTLMPHHIAAQAAIFSAILAYLLHCLVDLPMRVPPLALMLIVLMAVWSAGDRLWLFPTRAPRPEEEVRVEEESRVPDSRLYRFSLSTAGRVLVTGVGIVVAAGLATGVVMLCGTALNRFQTTAVLINRGGALLAQHYGTPGGCPRCLEVGWNDAYMARRTLWISGPANRLNGQAQYLRAMDAYDRADELASQGQMELAAKTRAFAETLAMAGISDLNMALSEERFHTIYRIRSSLNKLIADNAPEPRRRDFESRFLEDLYRAVSLNPGDSDAIFVLIQTLERDQRANFSEIVRYLGVLHHFHGAFFQQHVFGRVADALAYDESPDALGKMKMIIEAVPDDADYLATYARTLLANGQVEESRQLIHDLEGLQDASKGRSEFLAMLDVGVSIEQKEYAEARKQLVALGNSETIPSSLIKSYLLFLPADTDEQLKEKPLLRDEIEALGKQNPIHYQIAGVTALTVFHDWNQAAYWLSLRKKAPAPAPEMDLQGQVLLAKAYARLERWDDLQRQLEEITCNGKTAYSRRLCGLITRGLKAQFAKAQAIEPPAGPTP